MQRSGIVKLKLSTDRDRLGYEVLICSSIDCALLRELELQWPLGKWG
jgi:hypothetical protein